MIPATPFASVVSATQGHGMQLQWVVTDALQPAPGDNIVGMGYLHSQIAAETSIRERLSEAAGFPVEFRIVQREGGELRVLAQGTSDASVNHHYTAWTHPLRAVRTVFNAPGSEMQYRYRGQANWCSF